MVDLHSHILPNIDDGSQSIEETFKLIEEAIKAGFKSIILTPHYIEGYYEKSVEETQKLKEAISQKIKEKNVKIYIGNEIYLTENIIKLIKEKQITTINNTKYALFEMPLNSEPMNIYDVVYDMLQYKLIPILAHPERYSYIQQKPELIYDLIQKGVLMQSNYGSFIGYYGKKAQIIAKKMLENNMTHFLGSDVHKQKTIYPEIPQIIKGLEKIIGRDEVEKLTKTNPKLILENKNIEIYEPKKIQLTIKEKIIMKIKK